MMHYINIFCASTTVESRSKIWYQSNAFKPPAPGGLGCCPFKGSGPVVVDSLLIVTPIVGFCNVLCFVVRYFMSILVLQSSRWGSES